MREFAKKVDDKIKDTVLGCLNSKIHFDLDAFINSVCTKFEQCKENDAPIVLLEWINQLHSSPSVNVTHQMPRFLQKFLSAIEQ